MSRNFKNQYHRLFFNDKTAGLCGKFLLVTLLFTGCKNSLKEDIINNIDDNCKANSGCIVRIKDVTKFNWNKLFVFGAWTSSDSIKSKINLPYSGEDVPDDYVRLIFIDNNKICYEEDILQLDNFNSTLIFPGLIDSLNKARVNYFSPLSAIFNVKKGKNDSGCQKCYYYGLRSR